MAENTLLETIGRFFFTRNQIRKFDTQLSAAGFYLPSEAFAGWLFVATLLIALIATALSFGFSDISAKASTFLVSNAQWLPAALHPVILFILFLAASYVAVMLVSTSMIVINADARRNALEEALPDFLLLVAANVRAGLALDQAMWYAAKPEYGLLSLEVKPIIKGSFSGESFESALDKLAARFDSKIFARTISLIKQSSSSGGEVADVLIRTSQDVRDGRILKKEVSASLVLYEIFILFASVFGTPFLFAVAGKLVEVFERYRLPLSGTQNVNTGIFGSISTAGFSNPIITASEFFYFSIATILITTLFSSFIVGVIRAGSRNEGLKFFPFMIAIAYIVYFVVNSFLTAFFSTLA